MGERMDETPQERDHRRLGDLLEEMRVALPGVQVLFAFLLTVAFTSRFEDVTQFQKDVYYASLMCSAAATGFLIAPAAIHRLNFEQGQKPRIVSVAHVMAIIGLLFLALAMTGVVLLVTDVLYDGPKVVIYTCVVGGLLAVLWYLVPLIIRFTQGLRD